MKFDKTMITQEVYTSKGGHPLYHLCPACGQTGWALRANCGAAACQFCNIELPARYHSFRVFAFWGYLLVGIGVSACIWKAVHDDSVVPLASLAAILITTLFHILLPRFRPGTVASLVGGFRCEIHPIEYYRLAGISTLFLSLSLSAVLLQIIRHGHSRHAISQHGVGVTPK